MMKRLIRMSLNVNHSSSSSASSCRVHLRIMLSPDGQGFQDRRHAFFGVGRFGDDRIVPVLLGSVPGGGAGLCSTPVGRPCSSCRQRGLVCP